MNIYDAMKSGKPFSIKYIIGAYLYHNGILYHRDCAIDFDDLEWIIKNDGPSPMSWIDPTWLASDEWYLVRHKKNRGKMRSRKRKIITFKLLQMYGRHCYYCGDRMSFIKTGEQPKRDNMTIEHLHGRSNKLKNLVLACYDCNQERSRKTDPKRKQWIKKNESVD